MEKSTPNQSGLGVPWVWPYKTVVASGVRDEASYDE